MSRDRTIEEALRRALSAEAETVETAPDALGTIRSRVERRSRRWWVPRPGTPRGFALTLAGAAAAVVVAAGAVAVAAGWPGHRGGPGPGPGASGPSVTGTPVAGTNLPVYYLGPSTVEDRLYREYHVFPGTGLAPEQAVRTAVQAMLSRPADDPDYRSPWPASSTVGPVTIDGTGVATVDLVDAAGGTAFDGTVDGLTAQLAVQQLVYTVTAAVPATATSTGVTGVRLLLDGQPATTLWGRATASGVLLRGPAADVLAPIWIIDPQQGTRQGRRFQVHVAGIVFEATMRLRVLDQTGTVVADQTVHLAGGAPAQGTATVDLALPPGTYTIEGYLISAQDGTDRVYDDHQFTVG
jgi:hypothetical protein